MRARCALIICCIDEPPRRSRSRVASSPKTRIDSSAMISFCCVSEPFCKYSATKRLLAEYLQNGSLTQQKLIIAEESMRVFGDEATRDLLRRGGSSMQQIISAHLARIKPGDYFALTEYIEELNNYESLLQQIRIGVRDEKKVATTSGYGPRFLHSTGQLHKGGHDSGVDRQI